MANPNRDAMNDEEQAKHFLEVLERGFAEWNYRKEKADSEDDFFIGMWTAFNYMVELWASHPINDGLTDEQKTQLFTFNLWVTLMDIRPDDNPDVSITMLYNCNRWLWGIAQEIPKQPPYVPDYDNIKDGCYWCSARRPRHAEWCPWARLKEVFA